MLYSATDEPSDPSSDTAVSQAVLHQALVSISAIPPLATNVANVSFDGWNNEAGMYPECTLVLLRLGVYNHSSLERE